MSAAEIAAVYRQNLAVLMFADPANIDALAVHLQAENIKRARFRSRPFAPTDTLARALADVSAPLKTIWGTRDIIARPSLEARLDILRRHHPELEVRLIEGAGHWVAYEAADRFNAALLELLRGDEAPSPHEEWGEGTRASRSLRHLDHALAAVVAGEQADQRARRVLEAVDHVLLDLELAGRHP